MTTTMDWTMLSLCCCFLAMLSLPRTAAMNGADTVTTAAPEPDVVRVDFYQLSEEEWDDSKAEFQQALVDGLNARCAANPEECSWNRNLTASDVVFVSAPIQEKYTYTVQFYVNDTGMRVPAAAVEAAATDVRESLNEAVGRSVIRIGEEKHSPPPNHDLNLILIPIAGGIFIILLIAVIVLYCAGKKADKKAMTIHKNQDQDLQLTKTSAI